MVELVDTPDLKSGVLRDVWVQLPLEVRVNKRVMKSIKEIVKNNIVEFSSYRADTFYYVIKVDEDFYQFSIERSDIEGSTLMAKDKAILFMRWINKAIKSNSLIKI